MLYFLPWLMLSFWSMAYGFQLTSVHPRSAPINTMNTAILYGEDLESIIVKFELLTNFAPKIITVTPNLTLTSEAHIQLPVYTAPSYWTISISRSSLSSPHLLLFQFYQQPSFSCCEPDRVAFYGSEIVTIRGDNFFNSSSISVKLSAPWLYKGKKIVRVQYVSDTVLTFQAPVASYPRDYVSTNYSMAVSLAMDGVNYVMMSDIHFKSYFAYSDKKLVKFGFLYLNPISDLGWTFSQNSGRKSMEARYPGILTTDYVEEVTMSTAVEEILDFCKQEFDVIVTGSYDFFLASKEMSSKDTCKNSHIVSISGPEASPNLSVAFAKVYQAKYLAGMTAGYMLGSTPSQSYYVCYIGALTIAEVYRGFNAFYLGCFRANNNCIVKTVFIGTFHNLTLERHVAEYMWNMEGCEIIAQETDSAEPSIVFSQLGGYSIGYSSDMSSVVGNSVLTSPFIEWKNLFSHFLDGLIDDGDLSEEFYWPGMEEGAVNLWPFSNEVDLLTRNRVTDVWQKIQDGDEEVFCKDKYVLQKDIRGTIENISDSDFKENGCLKESSLLEMNYPLQGVKFLEPRETVYGAVKLNAKGEPIFYRQEIETVLPVWMGAIFMLIASLGILTVCFTSIFMYKNRTNKWFKSHSVRMMWFILVGCLLLFILPFLLYAENTDTNCKMTRFVAHLAFAFCAPPICLKTYRLHKFFAAARHLQTARCTDKQLISIVVGCLITYAVFSIFWFLVGDLAPKSMKNYLDESHYFIGCKAPGIMDTILAIQEVLALIMALQLVVMIRSIPKQFNESKYIAFVLYTCLFLGIILVPLGLVFLEEQPILVYILENFGILVVSWVTFLCLFGVKIKKILKNEKLATKLKLTQSPSAIKLNTKNTIVNSVSNLGSSVSSVMSISKSGSKINN